MSKFSRGNTQRSKLSALQVFNLRKEWAEGATQRYLSGKYGVSTTTIYNIVYGLTWKGLPTVASEDQVAFEAAQSLSKLNAAMDIYEPEDVGLTPEAIEKLNKELAAKMGEPEIEGRADIDEMFKRRSQLGGQQNEGITQTAGGIRPPAQSREAEGSIHGGSPGASLDGPFEETGGDLGEDGKEPQQGSD